MFRLKISNPEFREVYASENKVSFDKAYVSWDEKLFWNCKRCGKVFERSFAVYKRGTPYCMSCAIAMKKMKENLKDSYPEVAERYDKGGNDIPSSMVSPTSSMKAKFLCSELGRPHIYISSVYKAVKGFYSTSSRGCGICAGRQIIDGVNDVLTMEPKLSKMLYEGDIAKAKTVGWRDSKTYLRWVCPEGHVFEQTVSEQKKYTNTKYKGCPICSGREVKEGVNDFFTQFPELEDMWDYEKNTIDPKTITGRSTEEKCWFRCPNGHSFEAKPYAVISSQKHQTRGCPYCANQKVGEGYNDLESQLPELLSMWDYDKNVIKPSEISATNQNRLVWFKCSNGHSFESTVSQVRYAQKYKTKGCPICANKKIEKGINDIFSVRPDLRYVFPYEINEDIDTDCIGAGSFKEMNCYCENPDCDNIFSTAIYNWVNGLVRFCPDCREVGISYEAHELAEVIRGFGFDVEEEVPLWGDKRRVDILIPEKKLVIEYNGLYWHNEEIRGKNWHKERYDSIKELGYDLIYVWQDDWQTKKDIVLSLLRRKLGCSVEVKVNARDCGIMVINKLEAEEFLLENHIQGFVAGEEYLALEKDGDIVAVCVIQGDRDDIIIKRYATDCMVRGGFSKILKYIEREYDFKRFVTFSDNGVSDGSLYANMGFHIEKVINPDYKYIVNHKRVHKFNYRKERFRRDANLKYRDGLTESDLATLNGLQRVYDAGKLKWVKEIKDVSRNI